MASNHPTIAVRRWTGRKTLLEWRTATTSPGDVTRLDQKAVSTLTSARFLPPAGPRPPHDHWKRPFIESSNDVADRVPWWAGAFPAYAASSPSRPGSCRMPRGRYVVLTIIGSTVWNAVLIGAGDVLGTQWERVADALGPLAAPALRAHGARRGGRCAMARAAAPPGPVRARPSSLVPAMRAAHPDRVSAPRGAWRRTPLP